MELYENKSFADIDPETRKGLREKRFHFRVLGVELDVTLLVPAKINQALKSHHWDAINQDVRLRATQYVARWKQLGSHPDMLPVVYEFTGKFIMSRIYDVFTGIQQRRGNQAWEVPETLNPTVAKDRQRLLCKSN